MPNWCANTLELKHADPEMIKRAKDAFEAGRLLDEFIPIPLELKEGAKMGNLSLLMKGETLPAWSSWEGNPVQRTEK